MATQPKANQGAPAPFSLSDVQALIKPATVLDEYTSFCFYGQPKTGKTWLSASSGLRTLVIDCRDVGVETLTTHPYARAVDVWRINRFPGDLDKVFWFLRTQKHPYKVVVIDNVTTLASIILQGILGEKARALDFVLPEKGSHFNHQTQMLVNIIYEWRDLIDRMHVVFLAQERTFVVPTADGTETVEKVGASLGPSARATLDAAVSTIGRLYTEEVNDPDNEGQMKTVRRLLLGPEPRYIAGSRIKGLPHIMRGPTLRKILDIRALKGEVDTTTTVEEAASAAEPHVGPATILLDAQAARTAATVEL